MKDNDPNNAVETTASDGGLSSSSAGGSGSESVTPPALEQVDWTSTPTDESEIKPQMGEDYDPRPQEDQARRHIAYALIGLLWVVVGGVLILVAFQSITVEQTKDFAVLLGPVVTLVSAATGFYYGTKSTSS